MNEISLSSNISSHRREKNLTQVDLANFLGVTKASVSKWETGLSYPDITLLPRIAAFFDISIDDLMGYQPQMSNDNIRKLYKELSLEFASKPFYDVMDRCRSIVKKYFSCFPLLFQIGVLYINYGYYTVDSITDDEKIDIVKEAKILFLRIKSESGDIELCQLTNHLIATCELLLNNPDEVIRIFKDTRLQARHTPITNEILLSQAYRMIGKIDDAKTELQNSIYDGILNTLAVIPTYLEICINDKDRFDEICKRATAMIELWNANNLVPAVLIPFYLCVASGYLAFNMQDKALDYLDSYVTLVINNMFPIILKRDDFFDMITIDTDNLPFGTAEIPRDEKSIKQSLIDGLINNPTFESLQENSRFINLSNRLINNLLEGK